MIPIEICINCDSLSTMRHSVRAALEGGASRIELCRDMDVDGLTPAPNFIEEARALFTRPGVMVMIRPRPGNFEYTSQEIAAMHQQIERAAECGADGVVFGVLNRKKEPDIAVLKHLINNARSHKLSMTFHRAFDATPQPTATLETLIALGMDRVLTSGTSWGSGTSPHEGIASLQHLLYEANNRIEIVVAGGISPQTVQHLTKQLPLTKRLSFHAYSGVRQHGTTDATCVRQLVDNANPRNAPIPG